MIKPVLLKLNKVSGGALVKIYDSKMGNHKPISTEQVVAKYLSKHEIRKLNIGCGINVLPHWLNTDLLVRKDIDEQFYTFLDATQPFPIPDNSFDFAFSEHMIEHIPYNSALNMVKEIHRVLKINGKIRLTTPNLKFLIDLYSDNKSKVQEDYIKWSYSKFCTKEMPPNETSVINNFFYNWGHSFIYDQKGIAHLLELAGFSDIKFYSPGISETEVFKNIEKHGVPDGNLNKNIPMEFNLLESLTVEATKI